MHMSEPPIFSPDGSHTWTGTKWVPIQSEPQHSSEYRNPFQSQHSVIEVGNHASNQIEETYASRGNVEYIDEFMLQPQGVKWNYYRKIVLPFLWLGVVCLLAYFGEYGSLAVILLVTIGVIFASSFSTSISLYWGTEHRTLHSRIILVLLGVGGIVFVTIMLLNLGGPEFVSYIFIGFLLTGAYFVPAALLYQAVIFYDKQIETLGWKRGMIRASQKMVIWSSGPILSIVWFLLKNQSKW